MAVPGRAAAVPRSGSDRFESEISSLKESLSERLLQMRSLQVTNDKLEIEIEIRLPLVTDQKRGRMGPIENAELLLLDMMYFIVCKN